MIAFDDPIKKLEPLWGNWYAEEVLGKGSYGTVYRAYRGDDRSFYSAVKLISIPKDSQEIAEARQMGMDEASMDAYFENQTQRIRKEIELLYKFRGEPNIVMYEDHMHIVGPASMQHTLLIRMELLTPLTQYVAAYGNQLPPEEVKRLGIEICTALDVCACNNVIHRDVKEGNVFLNARKTFKLGDFGIAREMGSSSMSMRGTPSYVAPEIYNNQKYDARADIYSLGILMYKLLNNSRYPFLPPAPAPITNDDVERAFMLRMRGSVPELPCNGSDHLKSIVMKAMSFDPDNRFSSAREMIGALKAETVMPYFADVQDTQNIEKSTGKKSKGLVIGLIAAGLVLVAVFAQQIKLSNKDWNSNEEARQPLPTAGSASFASDFEAPVAASAAAETPYQNATNVVTFNDAVFESLIRQRLNRPYGDITYRDLESIESLAILGDFCFSDYYDYYESGDAENRTEGSFNYQGTRFERGNLRNISDIVYLKNLKTLSICCTSISDISPLAELKNVTSLKLNSNIFLEDISPLAYMDYKGLELSLWRNNIADISALQNMTQLTNLQLSSNKIYDLWPLANLTNLNDLNLYRNEIYDIAPIANLYNLKLLRLNINYISDISPLAGLYNLEELRINGNEIYDVSPLSSLYNLHVLYIQNNHIRNMNTIMHLNITEGNVDNQS